MEMEVNRIYCESNLETLSRMPHEFIDLTVTSPPYDDVRTYNGYAWSCSSLSDSLFRVTKQGGVVVWVVCDRTVDGDETGTSFKQALTFKANGWKLWDTMIFAKNNPMPGDCGNRYKGMFEYMFVFSKGAPKTFHPKEITTTRPGALFDRVRLEKNGRNTLYGDKRPALADTRKVGNIFFYAVGQNGNDLSAHKHPAVFPEQLARDQITSWSNEGDLVYDPFMGSGTTAKAAHQLGRNWIGSEISSEYVELANKRLEPYLAQANLFEVTR